MAGLIPRIEFLLWTSLEEVQNATVKRECAELTAREFQKVSTGRYPLNRNEDVRVLLQGAIGADWCAVIQAGSVFQNGFIEAVEQTAASADPGVFMFGHILDRKHRGFGLHEQFMLIDRRKWKQAGAPDFQGPWPTPVMLAGAERSPDNIHDDYTPLWVRPAAGAGEQSIAPKIPGWNFIDLALRNGFEVRNVPDSIRRRKDFLYPEKHPEILSEGIAALISDKARLRDLALEPYQKELLANLEP